MAPMTRPWSDIEKHYADLSGRSASIDQMLALVKKTATSRFAPHLYAWTSMHDLCIVQMPVTYPYDGPYLRISPLRDGKLEFRFVDTPVEQKQWCRTVDGQRGFERLERFLYDVHWFYPEPS